MDFVRLEGLRVRGHHGVFDFERRDGQDFVVDVTLGFTFPTSDDVADTVHYGELASRLAEVVSGEPVNLLETLAARLLDVCLSFERVNEATVTVHKPQAPIPHAFNDVSVTMHRRASDTR
ncbi:dihydroneopterin aldolase [Allorhizocola rhizosphaerae]|uniref:dihydroneopterin aldolase n=1 Tax=Allorhizocola rhizosphaerae TaxID=1872709 RepID=UPI000E3BF9E9|nr:dihydroneopterin aldolase [Allorhizocola rhizosphaerae]